VGYGSAMLMRGKSLTCRESLPKLAVYDRGSETLEQRQSVPASQRLAAHRSGKAMAGEPRFALENRT